MVKRNKSIQKPPILKTILVLGGLFTFLFGGIVLVVMAVGKFQNYNSPYLFAFSFGAIGLAVGIIIARKIKPYVILSSSPPADYSMVALMFSVGFIGSFLLAGHYFNAGISTLHKCDRHEIVGRQATQGGYRRPALNILTINIEQKEQQLLCSEMYWLRVRNEARVCIFNSPIGFDYLTLPDDTGNVW